MYSPNGDILTNYIKFGIVNGTALDNAFGDEAKVADYLSETTDKNTIANTLNILNKGRGEKIRQNMMKKLVGFYISCI